MVHVLKYKISKLRTDMCDFIYFLIKPYLSVLNNRLISYTTKLNNKSYNSMCDIYGNFEINSMLETEGINEINKLLKEHIKTEYNEKDNTIVYSIVIIE